MLDPLTALSVAGTIIQFVDFSSKLLAKSHEIYASGASVDNFQLEEIARDLEGLNARLQKPLIAQESLGAPRSDSDLSLLKLGEQCASVAVELIAALEELKVRGKKHMQWKNFRNALKSVWRKEAVDAINMRLQNFREELGLHILVTLRENFEMYAIKQQKDLRKLDEDSQTLAAKIQQDKEQVLDTWSTTPLASGPETAAEKQKKISLIEALLLQSLRFSNMTDRLEEIQPAHRQTYEWIFRRPDPDRSRWSDLPINGKAASGKSTLLCDDDRTPALLKHWSQAENPLVASHFFWYNGTLDQRSHSGLLRALPFKILRHSGDNLTFCVFIDGLDEYDGEYSDIIELFVKISTFANVKACLSSRPLYDFSKAFGSLPGLRLQDLAFGDIKQYVDDELRNNQHMQDLQRREPHEAPKLVLEIVDKADGVFLWVRLVVLSLLCGLRNSDQISDLQARLRILPQTLEDMFSHILGRLEPVYFTQSSRIFQMFLAVQSLDCDLPTVQLSLAEEHNCDAFMQSENERFTHSELVARCEMVETWLQTRCGDLIESHGISAPQTAKTDVVISDRSRLSGAGRDMGTGPRRHGRRWLQPSYHITQSHVLYLKFVVHPISMASDYKMDEKLYLKSAALQALGFAECAETDTGKLLVPALDAFSQVCSHHLQCLITPRSNWATLLFGFPEERDPLLCIAVNMGLYSYVSGKIKANPGLVTRGPGRRLLQYAVGANARDQDIPFRLDSRMVELLLAHGAWSDIVDQSPSTWEHYP
ncbi:hypothetical protein BDZ45DRAFT_723015 [Acephala macrosclerotiorum]|nr:hypothetical protein BDZ45DRAFT_723015 [Acephala macrosclerotiorum]